MASCMACREMREGIRVIENEITTAYVFDIQSRIRAALKKREAIIVRLALHIAALHTPNKILTVTEKDG